MSDILDFITGSHSGTAMDKGDVGRFAKEACDAFMTADTPLNDSISKIASREGLSQEQVRRVVESTNLAAFSAKFASGFSGNVDFDIATPDCAAVSERIVKTAGDYTGRAGKRFIPGAEKVSWSDMFPSDTSIDLQKVAQDTQDTKDTLRQIDETNSLTSDFTLACSEYNMSADRLRRVARGAVAEGNHAQAVLGQIKSAGLDEALYVSVLGEMPDFKNKTAHVKIATEYADVSEAAADLKRSATNMADLYGKIVAISRDETQPMIGSMARRVLDNGSF